MRCVNGYDTTALEGCGSAYISTPLGAFLIGGGWGQKPIAREVVVHPPPLSSLLSFFKNIFMHKPYFTGVLACTNRTFRGFACFTCGSLGLRNVLFPAFFHFCNMVPGVGIGFWGGFLSLFEHFGGLRYV